VNSPLGLVGLEVVHGPLDGREPGRGAIALAPLAEINRKVGFGQRQRKERQGPAPAPTAANFTLRPIICRWPDCEALAQPALFRPFLARELALIGRASSPRSILACLTILARLLERLLLCLAAYPHQAAADLRCQ
jgi:hypothetical protein